MKFLRVKLLGLDSEVDWKRLSPQKDYKIGNIQFILPDEKDEDLIVVFNSCFSQPITTTCNKAQRIFICTEPANYKRYNENFLKQFGTIISTDPYTKHKGKVIMPPAIPWHVARFFSDEKKAFLFDELKSWSPKKTKLCSVICSDKTYTQEHRNRLEFVQKLKQHFGDRIDFYGRGFNTIDDKITALEEYRYHIALENTMLPDYWTEKIADPFLALSYPIYSGCSNLEDYFDSKSFTRIDISKPEEAFKIIEQVLSSDLDKTSRSLLEESKNKVLHDYNIFNTVYDALSQANLLKPIPHSNEVGVILPESRFFSKPSIIKRILAKLKYIARGIFYKFKEKRDYLFYLCDMSPHVRWIRANGDQTLRLDYNLTKDDVVIDAGGYIGEWSEKIYNKFQTHIHIFEPEESFVKFMQEKFDYIRDNFQIHESCLSNADGEVEFVFQDDASAILLQGTNDKPSKKVKKVDVSSFLARNKLDRVALLKLNIEGEEYNVLDRLIETGDITKFDNIQVQFHLFADDAKERYKVLRKELSKTHFLTWRYPFVWENWRKR